MAASAEAYFNLGESYRRAGKLEAAIDAYRNAVQLAPGFAEAHASLGGTLGMLGRFDEAIAACTAAVRLQPGHVPARNSLGLALQGRGRTDEAIAAFRQAIAIKPDHAFSHNNLGSALQAAGRLDDAVAAFAQAVRLQPNFVYAANNLGNALQECGRVDEALAAFGHALRLDPSHPNVHWNFAMALLLKGDFARGWLEYEWRLKCADCPARKFSQPMWDGADLGGRTILLHAEQGLGDAIQFARYAALVAARGGRVILECQPALVRLFKTLEGVEHVIAMGEGLPAFDVHCPLLSLPRAFATRLETVPTSMPYLRADAKTVEMWREKIGDHPARLKVGLAWAGSRSNPNDRNRSVTPRQLAPLTGVPGIQFFSLQKGQPGEPADVACKELGLIDYTRELHDFAETAGLISNLDLVITIDTSVAHLAGAMGKRVWVLLPFAPDWRWMLGRADSPWYPTMRLFRQPARGDWAATIEAVRQALESWATE
ncbi:MAG: hypothetical protein JWN24_2151 [Phycisphaerales bacterium]|nr:hypothetical protein [Phycisphaerales bacterium]